MWIFLNIYIILTSIVFLPFAKLPYGKSIFLEPKAVSFTLLGLGLLSYNLISNSIKIHTFKNKWLGWILIYTILQFGWIFLRPIITPIEGKIVWNLWHYLPFLNLVIGIFLIQNLVEYTDILNRWLNVSKVLIWLGFGFSIYALLQFIGIDQIFPSDLEWVDDYYSKERFFKNYRMITFFGNKMQTATFLAVISPLCLMFKSLRYKLIYLIIGGALLLLSSLHATLAFLGGLIAYLFLSKKYRLTLTVLILSIIGAITINRFYPEFFNLYGKLKLYKEVFLIVLNRPFTGFGLGSFEGMRFTIDNLLVEKLGFASLQIFLEGGLILLALVSIYLTILFIRILLAKESMLLVGFTAGLVSFLIASLAGYVLNIAPFALIGIIYIASIEAQLQGG